MHLMSDLSPRARKTIYRCTHRGTKELDLILGSFARAHVADMDAETLQAFEDFTELPEPILQDILTDKMPLPVDMPAQLSDLLTSFTYAPEGL